MATESKADRVVGDERSLTRRAINAIAPDPAHSSMPRRTATAVLGGAGLAAGVAGVAGVVDVAGHMGATMGAVDPLLITGGAVTGGVAAVGLLIATFTDNTGSRSAAESRHWGTAANVSRRVQAASVRVGLATVFLAGAAEASGVAGGGHTASGLMVATAAATGAWGGSGVVRSISQRVANRGEHAI